MFTKYYEKPSKTWNIPTVFIIIKAGRFRSSEKLYLGLLIGHLDFNLKCNLCFSKTFFDHNKHSFEENFREKSLPDPILERSLVLGRLNSLNPSESDGKMMKEMDLLM